MFPHIHCSPVCEFLVIAHTARTGLLKCCLPPLSISEFTLVDCPLLLFSRLLLFWSIHSSSHTYQLSTCQSKSQATNNRVWWMLGFLSNAPAEHKNSGRDFLLNNVNFMNPAHESDKIRFTFQKSLICFSCNTSRFCVSCSGHLNFLRWYWE